jgi:oxygen-independent coproporphyrinogen-3 oxidase
VSLYVHVPFCVRRCAYCDFASEVVSPGRVGVYLEALGLEARTSGHTGARLHTVYVGGGTPTCLARADLRRVFEVVASSFDASSTVEWTVEANPGTVSVESLRELRELGAGRLSMGVQSFDDALLAQIGRVHTARGVVEAFGAARAAGFDNVSVDLIYALPGQTLAGVREDARRAVALGCEHVSVYGLTYEPLTRLTRSRDAGEFEPAGEELERRMYLGLVEDLERAGYRQYEIASFALSGREAVHNTVYWTGGAYLGLGPAAASFVNGVRWTNCRDLSEYARMLADGARPVAETEALPVERAAREALVLGLRLRRGIDPAEFARRTGVTIERLLDGAGCDLLAGGWLEWHEGRLRLATAALPVADEVLLRVV